MTGWMKVDGRNRCGKCGALVHRAWLYFTKPGLWTHCVCEPCAEGLNDA